MGNDSWNDDFKERVRREARLGRTPTVADLIGSSGGQMMKGESPVPPLVQLQNELCQVVTTCLRDGTGALRDTLHRLIRTNEPLLTTHQRAPLGALVVLVEDVLSREARLAEVVREADTGWGRLMGERPHFDRPGAPPHPEDEYTLASVREDLTRLLAVVRPSIE